jgi:hypothetical protein
MSCVAPPKALLLNSELLSLLSLHSTACCDLKEPPRCCMVCALVTSIAELIVVDEVCSSFPMSRPHCTLRTTRTRKSSRFCWRSGECEYTGFRAQAPPVYGGSRHEHGEYHVVCPKVSESTILYWIWDEGSARMNSQGARRCIEVTDAEVADVACAGTIPNLTDHDHLNSDRKPL